MVGRRCCAAGTDARQRVPTNECRALGRAALLRRRDGRAAARPYQNEFRAHGRAALLRCAALPSQIYMLIIIGNWHQSVVVLSHFSFSTLLLRSLVVQMPSGSSDPVSRTPCPAPRTPCPAPRTSRPAGRTTCPAMRIDRPAGRTTNPAQRIDRPAQRTTCPAWRIDCPGRRTTLPRPGTVRQGSL